jgi:hypothetical protein
LDGATLKRVAQNMRLLVPRLQESQKQV